MSTGDADKNKNTMAIKELPVYVEPTKLEEYRFVEDGPVLGQGLISAMRSIGEDYWTVVSERLGIINKSIKPIKDVANATTGYVRREKDWLPFKALAIAAGGGTGLVMAMRRGGLFRRGLYTAGGVLTMTAFCFPQETVHVVRTGIAHSRMTWDNFKQSPEPKKS